MLLQPETRSWLVMTIMVRNLIKGEFLMHRTIPIIVLDYENRLVWQNIWDFSLYAAIPICISGFRAFSEGFSLDF